MSAASPPRPNLKEIRERAEAATAGPWSIESCGEKGDGANMIGVSFGPEDANVEHPLQGWLRPWDDAGEEIEYYRDELVAVCDHVNRNCGHDAEFIAAARTDIPLLLDYIDSLLSDLSERDAEIARLQGLLSKLQLSGRPNRKERRAMRGNAE